MAGVFRQRPKGLFGNMGPTDNQPPVMGQIPGIEGAPGGLAPVQQPQQPVAPKQNGWQRAAGIFADFAAGWNGQAGPYAAMMQRQAQEQRAAQQAAQDRENQFTDWRRQFDYQQKHKAPDPSSLSYFDDNAGNRYSYDPATGKQRLIFTDPNDKQFIQDGQLVTVPNVVRQQQGMTGGPAIGSERNGYRFKGGNPNDQNSWESVAQGGPTPPASGGFRR